MKKRFMLLVLCFLLPIYGENIQGNMAGLLQVESSDETSTVDLTLEEIVSLDYLYDNPFVKGIEIKFEIPQETKNYRNSFALYLYRSVTPIPQQSNSSYRGNQFFMQILPFASEFSVKIPFSENSDIRKDADSVVTTAVSKEDLPILITLLPIAKGLPAPARAAGIRVSGRPIFSNMGGLKILIEDEQDLLKNDTTILIDDKLVSWPQEYYALVPGLHHVQIQNELSGTRDFNVAIEQGQFSEIRYTLEESTPRISITAIKGIEYFLDGVILSPEQLNGSLSIEPGNHIITMKINEELSITREYSFSAGENHTISLDAQVLIEKD